MEADRKQRLSSHDEEALLFLSPYPRGAKGSGSVTMSVVDDRECGGASGRTQCSHFVVYLPLRFL